MNTLEAGDLITVALRARENGLLSRTEVSRELSVMAGGLLNAGFMANDDDRSVHYYTDEGITWVRGHVADDSPKGKALIAAHALAPELGE